MVAEVYPLKRMPRRFRVFDYLIPEGMDLERGDMVRIPFRNREIHGFVARVKEERPRGIQLKTISEQIDLQLSETEMAFYEGIAVDLAQSVASILYSAIPNPPKRPGSRPPRQGQTLTIAKKEAEVLVEAARGLDQGREHFLILPDLRRMAVVISAYMQSHPESVVSVIAPTVRDAELLAARLSHLAPKVITGKESPNARYLAWKEFRHQSSGLLIGTRLSALLLHPKLDTLFLVRSGHPNHKQTDRNPRYNTRLLSAQIREAFLAKRVFLDVLPRADELDLFRSEQITKPLASAPVEIVDMRRERNTAPHFSIGSSTLTAIENALNAGGRVICVFNRKGVSRSLRCNDCHHVFLCPSCQGLLVAFEHTMHCNSCKQSNPLPLSCPSCHGNNLFPRGLGNRGMARILQKLLPDACIQILEKGVGSFDLNANLLLVTNHYLENIASPFANPNLALIVDLDADMGLQESDFRALENTMLHLESWRSHAYAAGCPFVIQTDAADLFIRYLKEPRETLLQELEMRKSYEQPPAKRWMRILYRSEEKRKAEIAMDTVLHELKARVPNIRLQSPKQTDKGPEIELAVDWEDQEAVLAYFTELPDQFIIDTSAFL